MDAGQQSTWLRAVRAWSAGDSALCCDLCMRVLRNDASDAADSLLCALVLRGVEGQRPALLQRYGVQQWYGASHAVEVIKGRNGAWEGAYSVLSAFVESAEVKESREVEAIAKWVLGHLVGGIGASRVAMRASLFNQVRTCRLWRESAEFGLAVAQNDYSYALYAGCGVQANPEESVRMLRLAADQGYAASQFHLAWMYGAGHTVQRNVPEAVRLYRCAAELGDVPAQLELARILSSGCAEADVVQDMREAVRLWVLSGFPIDAVQTCDLTA
eukprot:m51a1_g5750 hypothetical protein (272) ;mRNA; f:1184533-1185430